MWYSVGRVGCTREAFYSEKKISKFGYQAIDCLLIGSNEQRANLSSHFMFIRHDRVVTMVRAAATRAPRSYLKSVSIYGLCSAQTRHVHNVHVFVVNS